MRLPWFKDSECPFKAFERNFYRLNQNIYIV